MWEVIGALAGLGSLLWSIFLDNRARIAAEEAAMWRSIFWIAVIVIAVLAFIIWRKHRRDSTKA